MEVVTRFSLSAIDDQTIIIKPLRIDDVSHGAFGRIHVYDIMAVYPKPKHLPAKVRFFIDALKAIYAKPGYWMEPR